MTAAPLHQALTGNKKAADRRPRLCPGERVRRLFYLPKKDRPAVYFASAEGSADDSQNLSPRKGAAVSESGGREPRPL